MVKAGTTAKVAASAAVGVTRKRVKVRPVATADLQQIDPHLAAVLRLVHDPRLSQWLGTAYGADMRPAPARYSAAAHLLLNLACPGGNVSIGFPALLLPALALAVAADAPRVTSIATLVAARLMAPVIAQFAAAAGRLGDQRWQTISVTSVGLSGAQGAGPSSVPLASFDITVAKRFYARIGMLSIDPGCAEILQDMISTLPVRHYAATALWRVTSRLRLASRSWTIALLRSLEVGDVLLCKDAVELQALNAQLFCGAPASVYWSGQVRINQQKVTIMSDMLEQDGATEGAASVPLLATGVAELEVPVHFEIESAALSIAQLSSLRPGYVIELAIPVADAQIRVVTCGQLLGRGKLVVIGDCLGVQIESLVAGSA